MEIVRARRKALCLGGPARGNVRRESELHHEKVGDGRAGHDHPGPRSVSAHQQVSTEEDDARGHGCSAAASDREGNCGRNPALRVEPQDAEQHEGDCERLEGERAECERVKRWIKQVSDGEHRCVNGVHASRGEPIHRKRSEPEHERAKHEECFGARPESVERKKSEDRKLGAAPQVLPVGKKIQRCAPKRMQVERAHEQVVVLRELGTGCSESPMIEYGENRGVHDVEHHARERDAQGDPFFFRSHRRKGELAGIVARHCQLLERRSKQALGY